MEAGWLLTAFSCFDQTPISADRHLFLPFVWVRKWERWELRFGPNPNHSAWQEMKGIPITLGNSWLQYAFITPVIITKYMVFLGTKERKYLEQANPPPAIFDKSQEKNPLSMCFQCNFTKKTKSNEGSPSSPAPIFQDRTQWGIVCVWSCKMREYSASWDHI